MVAISRGNARNRRVIGGKNPSSSLFSFPKLCIFLAVCMGIRLITMDKSEVHKSLELEGPNHNMQGQLGGFRGTNNKPKKNVEKKEVITKHPLDALDVQDKKRPEEHTEAPELLHDHVPEESPDEEKDVKQESPELADFKDVGLKTTDDSSNKKDLNPIVLEKKGTGPTSVGYVKDFVDERANPAYKHQEAPIVDMSAQVAKMTNEKSVLACFDEKTSTLNPKCSDHDTPLIAYNSQDFPRTWCSQEIGPKSAAVMAEHCTDEVAHLFPSEIPPLDGEHMPPIIIKATNDKVQAYEEVECNIPCRQEKGINFGVNDHGKKYYIDGEPWKITREDKKMDRTDYSRDQYYSAQSLVSSVPLSNYDAKLHGLRNKPALDFDTAENKAIYLVNDDCTARPTKRNRWFDAVRGKITVDAFGSCGHNAEVPEGMTIATPEGRIALSKKYRIVLAFDNLSNKDYISDIVWEAFVSGAVPVVVGAENIATRFPVRSFINVNDFSKWDDLADYVEKVINDKELWMSYHKWREDETAIAKVEAQNYFANTEQTCRLCRWAYAKKYGLGWDHTKQEVGPVPKVPKEKFCSTADHGLVSKPFSEQWVTKNFDDEKILEEDSDMESCTSTTTDGGIAVGSYKGKRKVFQHDGVTDFVISESLDDSADAETSLRLKFPSVRNPEGAFFYNTHTSVSTEKGSRVSSASIQDEAVKITVLANWDTTVKSTGEGIMEVVIKNDSKSITSSDAPRRVRVIIEELNTVVDKMTEFFPSSYCKQMTKDFIDPIGVYFVDS